MAGRFFWLDTWVAVDLLNSLYPKHFKLDMFKRCMAGNRVEMYSGGIRFQWEWVRANLNQIETGELTELLSTLKVVKKQLMKVVDALQKVPQQKVGFNIWV